MKLIWRISFYSLVTLVIILLGLSAITVLRIGRVFPFEDKDPDNSSYNLNKEVIDAGMANMSAASPSPDGTLVLINKETDGINAPATRRLEVRDVASSRLRATIPLPIRPMTVTSPFEAEMESVYNPIQFCNRGKYILVYVGGATFSILDASTYAQNASITLPLTIDRSAENPLVGSNMKPDVAIASSCAANAPVAAIELHFGCFGTGVTKVFNMDSGAQTGEISEDVAFGRLMNLDVSPSGGRAAILVERIPAGILTKTYSALEHNYDLVILDLKQGSVSRRILTGMDGRHVAFAGDDEVAVADNAMEYASQEKPVIQLFDIHTGAVSQCFRDPADGAQAMVAASSDGRLLFSYTGKESIYRESGTGYLQIARARFTIWERKTGKIIAQSPGLQVFKTDYKIADDTHTISERPTMQYSQKGNAVVVSWPGWTERIEVFTVKELQL